MVVFNFEPVLLSSYFLSSRYISLNYAEPWKGLTEGACGGHNLHTLVGSSTGWNRVN